MKEMETLAKMIIRDGASNKFILSQTDLPDDGGSEEACAASASYIIKDEHVAHAKKQKENKNDYSQKMASSREREDLNFNSNRLD